jgi:hypothetical protein
MERRSAAGRHDGLTRAAANSRPIVRRLAESDSTSLVIPTTAAVVPGSYPVFPPPLLARRLYFAAGDTDPGTGPVQHLTDDGMEPAVCREVC